MTDEIKQLRDNLNTVLKEAFDKRHKIDTEKVSKQVHTIIGHTVPPIEPVRKPQLPEIDTVINTHEEIDRKTLKIGESRISINFGTFNSVFIYQGESRSKDENGNPFLRLEKIEIGEVNNNDKINAHIWNGVLYPISKIKYGIGYKETDQETGKVVRKYRIIKNSVKGVEIMSPVKKESNSLSWLNKFGSKHKK